MKACFSEGEPFDGVTQWMEIDFRTFHANGIIFTLVENGNYSRIEVSFQLGFFDFHKRLIFA